MEILCSSPISYVWRLTKRVGEEGKEVKGNFLTSSTRINLACDDWYMYMHTIICIHYRYMHTIVCIHTMQQRSREEVHSTVSSVESPFAIFSCAKCRRQNLIPLFVLDIFPRSIIFLSWCWFRVLNIAS